MGESMEGGTEGRREGGVGWREGGNRESGMEEEGWTVRSAGYNRQNNIYWLIISIVQFNFSRYIHM